MLCKRGHGLTLSREYHKPHVMISLPRITKDNSVIYLPCASVPKRVFIHSLSHVDCFEIEAKDNSEMAY